MRALAARQHFAVPGEVPADLPVEVVPVEPPSPWRARIGRWRRPRGELAEGPFAARVRELAGEVDVVHLEETDTAWCDLGVSTPSLVHIHYLVHRDRSRGRPWQRSFREVLEFELGERAAIRRHLYLVASSPLVAEGLRTFTRLGTEIVVAPLSLDPALYAPARLDGPPTAGILGTAAWPPTEAAMRTLVDHVWPLVRERVPDGRLVVAGRGADRLGLAGDGVEVLGEFASAPDLLRRLSVLAFPLERGSGMKVKVLEAMASGVPVVTTPAGAEGIDRGVAVHQDVERIADDTARLLLDEAERRERGSQARSAFEELYAPEPATRPLVELYRRMSG